MGARSLARAALWNAAERRPRTPLRLLAHAVLLALAGLAAAVSLGGVRAAGVAVPAGVDTTAGLATSVVVSGTVVVVATLLAARYVDRRTVPDLGLGLDRRWWRDLAAGLALGAALQTGILLTFVAAGWTTVRAVAAAEGLAAALALGAVAMAAVGLSEELLFRGYYLTNLAEGLRAVPRVDPRRAVLLATALTAAAFGVVHGTNPNATTASSVLVGAYGAYLALGYVLTGDLALPVGFHAAWNYVQGFVYGFPVSGLAVEASLLTTRTVGPAALTGGRFGPEAGLVGLAWALASLPALWWWVRRTRGAAAVRADVARPALRVES